jgi:hypothetical protein
MILPIDHIMVSARGRGRGLGVEGEMEEKDPCTVNIEREPSSQQTAKTPATA